MNPSAIQSREISIPIDQLHLKGELTIPSGARSIIIFSTRNRRRSDNHILAERFNKEGYATLLFDLLTSEEEKDPHSLLDTEFLIQRLLLVTNWIKENELTKDLHIGYLGSGTGAAYALAAASMLGQLAKAVVSRGGHPEMALPYLPEVKSPVLMIVGGMDYYVLESNETAFSLLTSEKKVVVVEGATHSFEQPGKLDEVADHAIAWFKEYLP